MSNLTTKLNNHPLIRHTTKVYNLVCDEFDSATVGSVILGIGDIVWLSHDIAKNGFTTVYFVIAMLFLIGNVMLVIGIRQHHTNIKRKADKRKYKRSVKKLINREVNQYD